MRRTNMDRSMQRKLEQMVAEVFVKNYKLYERELLVVDQKVEDYLIDVYEIEDYFFTDENDDRWVPGLTMELAKLSFVDITGDAEDKCVLVRFWMDFCELYFEDYIGEDEEPRVFRSVLNFTVENMGDNGPYNISLFTINDRILSEPLKFPVYYATQKQRIEANIEKLSRFKLTEKGTKTLNEFLVFKSMVDENREEHPEGLKTYYNLLVYGDNPKRVDDFVISLSNSLAGFGEKVRIDEAVAISKFNDAGGRFSFFEDVFSENFIYISNCQEKPVVDEDAGTGATKDLATRKLKMYNAFWEAVTEYVKTNPHKTVVLGMTTDVYKTSFSKNNELNHRIFGHRIFVPSLTEDDVVQMCVDGLKKGSIPFAPDFEESFVRYIKTIYFRADLKEDEFVEDAINRVYSYYFRIERDDKRLTVDCIPPYDEVVKSADEVLGYLNQLTGLKSVKKSLKEFYMQNKVDPTTAGDNSYHMVFYGNPGTGKTTVARLTAELLCQMGIIRTNKLVEVSGKDLKSAWKSNSANKTMAAVKEALDGVLFIDEAYSIIEGENGEEVMSVLLKAIEDYRDRLVVIVAGYEKRMEEFLAFNEGLESRFPNRIKFEDYKVDELMEIFHKKCEEISFKLDPSAEDTLRECIQGRMVNQDYGNGRDIRNLVNSLHANWAKETFELGETYYAEGATAERVFYTRHFEDVMPAKNDISIDSLIGLDNIKEQLKKFVNQVKYKKVAAKMGLKNLPESYMHMVFMGNPGTGKTEVAKLIANDLYSLGVLKTNRLVVAERKDIVSKYTGDTSDNVTKLLEKATGGVLFIDEAYSLLDAGQGGIEAIEALITAMVDKRDDTIIIFAGYPEQMREFLQINPGIPSRIGYTFKFDNYKPEQLVEMFKHKMDKCGFVLGKGVDEKVLDIMEYFCEMPDFGNGRFVDNVVSACLTKRGEREYTTKNFNSITVKDIPSIGELTKNNVFGYRLTDPKKITKKDRLRTAYHELGHAFAMYECESIYEIDTISIKNRAQSLGRVSLTVPKYRNITDEEMMGDIIISLAGRNAERAFYGNCDTGCSSDYARAKEVADEMINTYGMCVIGETKVEDLLIEGELEAMKIIEKHKACIEEMAEKLVNGQVFTKDEFNKYVKDYYKNNKKGK